MLKTRALRGIKQLSQLHKQFLPTDKTLYLLLMNDTPRVAKNQALLLMSRSFGKQMPDKTIPPFLTAKATGQDTSWNSLRLITMLTSA